MTKRYLWDFFGPHATGRAEHFIKHLQQFIDGMELQGCQHGVEVGERGASAWCTAPEEAEEAIETRLRPHRYDAVEGGV